MAQVMTKFQKSRARLLLQHPFFATILMSTPTVWDTSIPTACTDMKVIKYNPEFMDSLDLDVAMFVQVHEACHILFSHGLRMHGRNPTLWNVACDYAINLMLQEQGFTVWDKCLVDAQYAGMSAEVIYDKLVEQMGESRKGRKQEKGTNPPQDGEPGDIWDDGFPQDGLGDDLKEPADMDADEKAKIERSIQQRVAQAASMARMAGKLSGSLEKFVTDILNPAVPWQALLRDYMTRISHDDETWSRRNRRFTTILPSRHSLRMGRIGVIRDISGSITHEEQAKTVAEVESIAATTRPELIHIVAADTRVQHEDIFSEGEPVVIEPLQGGGTDMRVPLEFFETHNPDVVVLITDGHTPWPAVEPSYPLIVCCTTDVNVPIGQVVRI